MKEGKQAISALGNQIMHFHTPLQVMLMDVPLSVSVHVAVRL